MYFMILLLVFLNAVASADVRCKEKQEALVTCILSHDVSEALAREEIEKMCSHTVHLLECVRDERASCPNMELLQDEEFSAAMDSLQVVYNTYCTSWAITTTDTSLMNDHRRTCNDPWDAITECNHMMEGLPPGDLKVMCSQTGEDYLQCLDDIVTSCDKLHQLTFDLKSALNTTRELLANECPKGKAPDVCQQKNVEAEAACISHLTDSTSDNMYCLLGRGPCLVLHGVPKIAAFST